MLDVRLDDLRDVLGLGVAGNFAGHLEQAGEAGDFVDVEAEASAPKGIFPFYVPGAEGSEVVPGFLGTFPVATDRVALPDGEGLNLQIEPEVGLLARVTYGADGVPEAITPQAVGAFNDCSIRRPGARKISEKKNWGPASKGLAPRLLPVDELDPEGATRDLRLASFLLRDGTLAAYGVDSPVVGYSYYGTRLLEWLVDRLRHQQGSDVTPLEPVGRYLAAAGSPSRILVGIGATRYTELGESTYLRRGDTSIVVVYDGARRTPDEIATALATGDDAALAGSSVLRQDVVAPDAA